MADERNARSSNPEEISTTKKEDVREQEQELNNGPHLTTEFQPVHVFLSYTSKRNGGHKRLSVFICLSSICGYSIDHAHQAVRILDDAQVLEYNALWPPKLKSRAES